MSAGRREIEALQLKKLRGLISELSSGNAFYKSRLKEAGVDARIASLAAFVERMPFTSKMDVVWDREEAPPYGTNLTYPLSDYSRFCQSSGTTSGPLPWLDTNESWSAMLDCWDRVFEAAEVDSEQVIFFAFSFGPFLGFWTAFDAAVRRGNRSIPGGGLGSEARLRTMAMNEAKVLCCTPTYAMRLGEVRASLANDSELAGSLCVEKIIVAGEPGGSLPEVREKLESLWPGARVFDHHGMTEVGPVSYERTDEPMKLCVIEESYFAEVIDRETLREVESGEKGELVLTTLDRAASPLLRYRTGDLVEKGFLEAGKDGSILALQGGVLGRVDEMVVIRGVNIYPTAIEKIIRSFPEVAEYQVIESTRDSMAELEIAVEPIPSAAGVSEDLMQRIGRALANAFTLRIPVRIVEQGALPRFEFKSRRWVKR